MEPVTEDRLQAWREALGATVKAERVLRDMEQSQVRDAIGVSRATYSRIERGYGATLEQIVAIAGALGLTVTELVGRAEREAGRRLALPADPPAGAEATWLEAQVALDAEATDGTRGRSVTYGE